jgi:hypothetical protein
MFILHALGNTPPEVFLAAFFLGALVSILTRAKGETVSINMNLYWIGSHSENSTHVKIIVPLYLYHLGCIRHASSVRDRSLRRIQYVC